MKTNNFIDSILVACFIFCGIYAIISINPFKIWNEGEKNIFDYDEEKSLVKQTSPEIPNTNKTNQTSKYVKDSVEQNSDNSNSELNNKIENISNSLDSYQNSYNTLESAYLGAYNNHLNGTERYKGEYANARNSTEQMCERAINELQSIAIMHRDLLSRSSELNSRLNELYNKFKNLESKVFAD